jgi:hypothetical protein
VQAVFIFMMILSLGIHEKPRNLEDFRWKNRLVLIFQNGSETNHVYSDSLMMEMKERKVLYFLIDTELESNAEVNFSNNYLKGLKSRYQIGEESSSWVLIGLDGGIKMRGEGDLNWNLIFKTIDSMPMRQSEIKSTK